MFWRTSRSPSEPGDAHRVVVVGSGPAGAMAALTIAEGGVPVTLMESGTGFPGGVMARLAGRTVLRRGPRLSESTHPVVADDPNAAWVRVLQPGGLSNYWSGAVPRFAPEDFDEGERLHEMYRWPLRYEDVVPFYERVERLLGVVGDPTDLQGPDVQVVAHRRPLPRDWQRIADGALCFGQKLVPLPSAAGAPWMVTRSATAFNSFLHIVRRLQRHPNFRLLLGAHVLRLEWSGDRRAVTGVVYHDRSAGCDRRLPAAAVVLAAGAVSTPKLLLDSACPDFPHGLGDTEGLLGRYLHEHVHQWFVLELGCPVSRLAHPAYLTRPPYSHTPPLTAASCTLGPATPLDRVLNLIPLKTRTFGVNVFGSTVPIEGNSVRSHPELEDEFGLPLPEIRLQHTDAERQTTVSAVNRLSAILESTGISCSVHPTAPVIGSSIHYGGTVRMHSSPRYGMADEWSRLHTVRNVAIADASCFTTAPEKNPTLTVMALAARAAERLAYELRTCNAVARR